MTTTKPNSFNLSHPNSPHKEVLSAGFLSPLELSFPVAPQELGTGSQTHPVPNTSLEGMPASPAREHGVVLCRARGQDFSSDNTGLLWLLSVSQSSPGLIRCYQSRASLRCGFSAGGPVLFPASTSEEAAGRRRNKRRMMMLGCLPRALALCFSQGEQKMQTWVQANQPDPFLILTQPCKQAHK